MIIPNIWKITNVPNHQPYLIMYIYIQYIIYMHSNCLKKNTHIFETTNQILVASPRDWEVTYPIISPCTAD